MRWSALAVVVVLVGATVYYQSVVVPELTATEYEFWVAGESDRVEIGVDNAADVVTVEGGRNGLSQIVASRGSLFVLADEVAAQTTATWVEIPWESIAGRPSILISQRAADALSVGHVRCEPLSSDAATMVVVLLGVELTGDGQSLCGAGAGAAADEGQDVLVNARSVRPNALPQVPGVSVVAVGEMPNTDAVLAAVSERLASE